MIVDRRKDNYDELQILAGDTRNRRRNANIWTTSLIAGGMILASAYVSTTNEQVNDLRAAGDELAKLRPQIMRLIDERDALRVERDIYKNFANAIANAAPGLNMGDSITNISQALGPKPDPNGQTAYRDIVWLVEGSRRFPMAEKDFLWIPEAARWVRLDELRGGKITVFVDRDNNTDPGTGQSATLPTFIRVEGRDPDDRVCLSLDGPPSKRPGFQTNDYADMVVIFQSGNCVFDPPNRGIGEPD